MTQKMKPQKIIFGVYRVIGEWLSDSTENDWELIALVEQWKQVKPFVTKQRREYRKLLTIGSLDVRKSIVAFKIAHFPVGELLVPNIISQIPHHRYVGRLGIKITTIRMTIRPPRQRPLSRMIPERDCGHDLCEH